MREKGITGFQLKLIGLLLMIFDHIHEFFNYNNAIPIGFKCVGRIVAPIFIFMTVEGYTHTRNKKKYMLRLFLGSIVMNLGNFILPRYFERTDNVALMNNIFATLFLITVYLCIVDFIKKALSEKNILKIFVGIILFIAPFAVGMGLVMLMSQTIAAVYLALIIPTPMFVEGGIMFIVIGIVMYLLKERKNIMLLVYSAISIAIMFTGEISIQKLFTQNFQWMMLFAAPLIYLYNGKKGKGMKYLFYVFYPAHIYLFFIISSFMMKK